MQFLLKPWVKLLSSLYHWDLPTENRPFASCPNPLFESEPNCKAFDMKMMFLILMQIKLIFTRKVLHLALFESEGFWNSEMAY